MTNIDEFNHNECGKIDPNCINAYMDYHLDKDNPAGLCIETSWGGDCLDLTSIVKAAETVTTLHLTPEDNPTCLQYEREDGQSDCITGDELSRIISLTKLKDVDQETSPSNGDVLIYRNGKWYPFDLQTFVDNTSAQIENLQNAVSTLQERVELIETNIRPILNRFELFSNVPDDAKIMLGNINLYSDTGAAINGAGAVTSLNKNHGIYGHALNQDKALDEIFG